MPAPTEPGNETEPIDADELRGRIGTRYPELTVVDSTGSTNADLRAEAVHGAADRRVLIAGEQSAGVGRRARGWSSPSGGLYLSVLIRTSGLSPARFGTLTVVAGLALLRVVRALGADAVLKWPNDLLAGSRRTKCAGILCEAVAPAAETPTAVVVGIGVNVAPLDASTTGPGGLPATSLAECGVRANRTELAARLLDEFDGLEIAWRRSGGDLLAAGLLDAYRDACDTLGRAVRVDGLGGRQYEGEAVDVDASGALVLRMSDGSRMEFSAGDVVHLRPVME